MITTPGRSVDCQLNDCYGQFVVGNRGGATGAGGVYDGVNGVVNGELEGEFNELPRPDVPMPPMPGLPMLPMPELPMLPVPDDPMLPMPDPVPLPPIPDAGVLNRLDVDGAASPVPNDCVEPVPVPVENGVGWAVEPIPPERLLPPGWHVPGKAGAVVPGGTGTVGVAAVAGDVCCWPGNG